MDNINIPTALFLAIFAVLLIINCNSLQHFNKKLNAQNEEILLLKKSLSRVAKASDYH